jgi:aldehyde:ferredoxin oxidoreductase
MTLGGYAGKLLRVDLTRQKTWSEPLPEERILRKYVGGVGLGMKILLEEVQPTVQAFDPDNRMILMTGPLSGTITVSSSRFSVQSGSEHHVPFSNSVAWAGGTLATYLKTAGFDGIVVQGASEDPVYLFVKDDQGEIRDASKLWGKDTTETDFFLKKELTGDPRAAQVSVASIGPGGENLVAGGCVVTDRNHVAAKGGIGAVWGSKKLKSIAVALGKQRVLLADRQKATDLSTRQRDIVMNGGITRFLKDGGVPRGYKGVSDKYFAMVKNLSDPEFGHKFTKAVVDAVEASKLTPRPCPGCPIGCAYDLEIATGPYKGVLVTAAGGAESMEGVAGNIGTEEGGTVFYITDLIDRLGLDSTITGETLGLAYEAYEKGLLTKDRTDGLELKWGNCDAAIQLLHKMCKREGFGNVLAEGVKTTAAYIGDDAYKMAVHIKGAGAVAHDVRTSWENLFNCIISSSAGAWQGQGVDGWGAEPDMGFPGPYEPFDKERVVPAVRAVQVKKQFDDCCGICGFSSWWVKGSLPYFVAMIPAVTGWTDFSREEALMVGDRVTNMMRIYNMRRGMTRADEYDIGARLLEAPNVGPAKDKSIKPYLDGFITDYYRAMGWDEVTGKPLDETVRRLGLEEYAKLLK